MDSSGRISQCCCRTVGCTVIFLWHVWGCAKVWNMTRREPLQALSGTSRHNDRNTTTLKLFLNTSRILNFSDVCTEKIKDMDTGTAICVRQVRCILWIRCAYVWSPSFSCEGNGTATVKRNTDISRAVSRRRIRHNGRVQRKTWNKNKKQNLLNDYFSVYVPTPVKARETLQYPLNLMRATAVWTRIQCFQ